jgi:dTDP-4-dehydrorhamnose reductase
MNICLLGPGFVGETVGLRLARNPDFYVTMVSSRIDWGSLAGLNYDVVVNCAGISRKFEVELDPVAAEIAEDSIHDRIRMINYYNPRVKVLHISSICAHPSDTSAYGDLKRTVENWMEIYSDPCILRLGGLVGPRLAKNVVFDWINQKPIRVSSDSLFNFISTQEVANIIEHILLNWKPNEVINVGARTSVRVSTIFKMRDINPIYSDSLVKESNRVDTTRLREFYPVKPSLDYLEDYLKQWEKDNVVCTT